MPTAENAILLLVMLASAIFEVMTAPAPIFAFVAAPLAMLGLGYIPARSPPEGPVLTLA